MAQDMVWCQSCAISILFPVCQTLSLGVNGLLIGSVHMIGHQIMISPSIHGMPIPMVVHTSSWSRKIVRWEWASNMGPIGK